MVPGARPANEAVRQLRIISRRRLTFWLRRTRDEICTARRRGAVVEAELRLFDAMNTGIQFSSRPSDKKGPHLRPNIKEVLDIPPITFIKEPAMLQFEESHPEHRRRWTCSPPLATSRLRVFPPARANADRPPTLRRRRVRVEDKRIINGTGRRQPAGAVQVQMGLGQVSLRLRQPLDAAGNQHEPGHRHVEGSATA